MNVKIIMQVVAQVVVGLFTSFVLEKLWNWFAVTAFNLHEISYWQMFGLYLFATILLFRRQDPVKEWEWQKAIILLSANVPEKDRDDVLNVIKDSSKQVWLIVVKGCFAEIILAGFCLGLGWCVHVYLTH